MTDTQTPAQRRATMRSVRSKNTKPEWIVRRALHRLGYRYRLHVKHLSGRPDLVFPSRRKVLFVHGCFWHAHDCARGARMPKSNHAYWSKKLGGNKARDAAQLIALKAAGWDVIVVWECETSNLPALVRRVRQFLD